MQVFLRSIAIFLFMILIQVFPVYGQHPVFRHFTVDDGLPSTEIFHVYQDSKGYIWLATNMGVSRYDGLEFRNFSIQEGLPENTVFEIYEDYDGRIWFIGFPFQLAYFKNGKIIQYDYNIKLSESISKHAIPIKYSFRVDTDNTVHAGLLFEGLISIDAKGEISRYGDLNPPEHYTDLLVCDDRVLVSQGDTTQVYHLRLNSEKGIFSFRLRPDQTKFFDRQLIAIKYLNDFIIYSQNNSLAIFEYTKLIQQIYIDSRILGINVDRIGNLWVGTEKNGVKCYPDSDLSSKTDIHYLKGLSVSSVLQDSEYGMWFSTLDNGLFYLPSNGFIGFTTDDGLSNNKVNSVLFNSGKVYIGTNDNVINILTDDKLYTKELSYNKKNRILTLAPGLNKSIWIGTNEYLYLMDSTGALKKYINKIREDLNVQKYLMEADVFSIFCMCAAKDSSLWLGGGIGLSKFKNGKTLYNSLYNDSLGFRATAIYEKANGDVLIGTNTGVFVKTDNGIQAFDPGNQLLNSRITDIVQYNDKLTIIATKGAGVFLYGSGSAIQVSWLNGLSSNSVTALHITGNLLWIATNYGLNMLDLDALIAGQIDINVYKKDHGLISNEITDITGDLERMYIATSSGMTIFDRKNHQPYNTPPPVYITDLQIMKKDTTLISGYSLPYNQNIITLKFHGISYRDAGQLIYQYRLKGLNESWSQTTNTEVEYAFLPPGKYIFEVVATSTSGMQSIHPAVFSFEIRQPVWRRWWFIALLLIFGILLFYLFYNNRIRLLRKENNLKNDINWYRQQALSKQMDPHFVFNTLNSIQSYIIKNDRLSSTQYLSKFAKLMRLILNNSQKQAVPLRDELDALSLYLELESLRFNERFEYAIIVDPDVDKDACYIPAFLIQPLVENAIWHGIMGLSIAGRIEIRISKVTEGNHLICMVQDNGIGRKKSEEIKPVSPESRKSIGISLITSRLNLLNNYYGVDMKLVYTDLYDEQGRAAGTRVVINLPLIS